MPNRMVQRIPCPRCALAVSRPRRFTAYGVKKFAIEWGIALLTMIAVARFIVHELRGLFAM